MLGLASTAMGLWEISTGLSGLGASVSAEFIGYGVGSIAAVPIAAGSFALIGKGVAEVSAGLAIWKNAETKTDKNIESIKIPENRSIREKTTPGNLQKQVQQGKAPKSVERVDKGRGDYEKDHVHFEDGSALNIDGSWKHGGRKVTRQEAEWLLKNGWKIPKV